MSFYQIFIRVMYQLSQSNYAHFQKDESEFLITRDGKRFLMSTVIYHCDEGMPDWMSFGKLRWQERGAYLKYESSCIYLIQEITQLPQFISFKALAQDFANVADEWKKLIRDFAYNESVSVI